MRGATAGSRIHLNQSTTIHTKSATLFIAARGVAFILIFLLIFLIAVSPSSADVVNGDFTSYLQNWTTSGSASYYMSTSMLPHPPYARLVAGDDIDDGTTTSTLSQVVDIPSNALLNFTVRSTSSTGGTGLRYIYLSIMVDGVGVGTYSSNSATSAISYRTYNLSSYSGTHTLSFSTSMSRGGASWVSGSVFLDNVTISGDYLPTLPESNGIISFDKNSYDIIDTVNVDLSDTTDELFIDWSSYDCTESTCNWQPAYHWSVLNPIFYYQDVPIIRVLEGTYENNTWYTLDTNPFLETGVSLVESPYSGVLNYQYMDSKNITSTDAAYLKAELVIRRDWYSIVGLDDDNHIVFKQLVGSVERTEDTDYAYHVTPSNNGNYSATNPTTDPYFPPQDSIPDPVDMPDDTTSTLPDDVDADDDGVGDNVDDDDNNDGKDDSDDSDDDGDPDVIDDDDDNDGIDDDDDVDDDGDGIPEIPITGPVDINVPNSTVSDPVGFLPSNNSTYTYSVLVGYYTTVNSTFDAIDGPVSGVLNFTTSPLRSLSSSIDSVNTYASTGFSSALISLQPASLIMDAVFDSMPSKLKGVVSYWLLLSLILIVLGRSW